MSRFLLLQLGVPGPAVFLEFPSFRDEAVGNADDVSLCDGLTCRCRVVKTLVQPHVEAFKWFVGIVRLPELPVFPRQVHH